MRFVLVRNDPLNLVHEYLLELFIVVTYIPILIHKSIEHKKKRLLSASDACFTMNIRNIFFQLPTIPKITVDGSGIYAFFH